MATYQVSVQGHGVSAATLTQGQWYQQPYQQYYQNYIGDYMQQQPIQYQSFAPQNQDAYNEASVAMATTQASIAIPSSQASAQSHGVSAATLTQVQWYQQPYHQYYENYVGDYMQQQQPMQLQSFAPQNQVIYVQVQPRVHHVAQTDQSQMQPQPQVKSQSLTMHQPHDAFSSPKDNTVQDSLAQNTIGQCQSNQPHASWTGLNPQPNQTNQVESPPNNMFEYHEDHFPEQGDWATKPFESLDFHSQSKEHQQKSMDMVSTMKHNEKKHKMAPLDSSQFGNQNKNEEGRLKGSGEKEENRSIVYHQY
uniref:Uncharacterized protein n=1 Tax=Brassica campestris TaxID=3711 RepID=M4CEH1_BRACM